MLQWEETRSTAASNSNPASWSSPATGAATPGADTAGVSRLQHSPEIPGDPHHVLGPREHGPRAEAPSSWAPTGCWSRGCHIGDCHYIFGNHWAIKQFEVTKKLLRTLGLETERVRLEWVSAAEGPRWAALIDEFVATITGPRAEPAPGANQR